MADNLWPEFTPPEQVKSPVFLLKEQAALLAQRTGGIVVGRLSTLNTPDGRFVVSLDLAAPALRGYRYRLLEVIFPPEFYPLVINGPGQQLNNINGEAEFRDALASVLRSEKTKQIVEAIMAQAVVARPSERT
jgi:hypothetical protein